MNTAMLLAVLTSLPTTAATLGTLLITNVEPATTSMCSSNPPVSSVSTSDSAVYAALPYSNGTGENLEFQWLRPDGSLHLRSTGRVGAGSGCRYSILTLDSSVSSLGGTWTVRVLLNGSNAAQRTFTMVASSSRTPRVLNSALITRNAGTEGCVPPEPVNSFTERDTALNIWYTYASGYAGQVNSVMWYNPSGGLEGVRRSNPLPSDGSFCSSSTFTLDGRTSRLFGDWKAVASYDGQHFFEITIPLNDSRFVDVPYELRVNQLINSNCPNFTILASVRDRLNNAISGLAAADFVLTEADGQQTPVQVRPAKDMPGGLSVAIVIDSSTSLSDNDLALEKAAARQLVDLLDSRDAVGVWSFTGRVTRQVDFTTDHGAAKSGVDAISERGGTALYQAVVAGAQALRNRGTRRAIIVLTDGEDTAGGATLDSAVQAALGENAPIFTIGFGGSNADVLREMADRTGGFYSPSATNADLQRILFALGKALTGQYEITYTSRNPGIQQKVVLQVKARGGESNTHTINGIPPCSPAPRSGTLTADPDPIILQPGRNSGQTKLTWTTTGGVRSVWIRYGSPAGSPITAGPLGPSGSTFTMDSVTNGDMFYLTDADTGDVLAPPVKVRTQTTAAPGALRGDPNPFVFCNDPNTARTYLSWNAPGYSSLTVRSGSGTGQAVMSGGATGGGPVNLLRPATDFFLVDGIGNTVARTTVTVSCQLPPQILAPDAQAGKEYNWRWPVPVGSGRWLWDISYDQPASTPLPEGLTLESDGTIHGRPARSSGGPLTFRLSLQDKGITGQPSAVMLVTLNILDEGTSPAPPIDTTIPLNAQWVASRSGASLPGDAIAGGREGTRDLYVCRARFNGSIFPGKTWGQGCYFGFGGAEWVAEEYDVLTGSADENLWSRDSNGALTGGSDAGTPAWPVCRGELVRDRQSLGTHPGRYLPDGCHIGYGGSEIVIPDPLILHTQAIAGAPSTGTTLAISNRSMTGGLIQRPDGSWDFCTAPASRSTFPTTDESAGIWFTFDNGRFGDVLSIRWIRPSGTVYTWRPSATLDYNGSGCYAWFIGIRGYPPESEPGTWRAQLLVNGSVVFGLPFTITRP